ncbi:unnamed protein product, partial [Ilex paraguariensis]
MESISSLIPISNLTHSLTHSTSKVVAQPTLWMATVETEADERHIERRRGERQTEKILCF